MEEGIITKSEDKKGIMRVNLNGLDKLEVSVKNYLYLFWQLILNDKDLQKLFQKIDA